jgi:hypothetical protein
MARSETRYPVAPAVAQASPRHGCRYA